MSQWQQERLIAFKIRVCNPRASKHWVFEWHIERDFGGYQQFREGLPEVTTKWFKWNFIFEVVEYLVIAGEDEAVVEYNNGR